MDKYSHSQNENDRADEESSELVPMPEDKREAPPLDIDEREHREEPSDAIELPAQEERSESSGTYDIDNDINEHQPLPTKEAYHNDDSAAPDPYDVDDQIDLTMPLPTGDAEDEVDDFSTEEELDVDTAPASRSDNGGTGAFGDDDRVRFEDADESSLEDRTAVYIGGPSDDDPINNESGFYPLDYGDDATSTTSTADSAMPDDEATDTDLNSGQEPVADQPPSSAETICPVCGRETDALRFCGHCGAPLTEERREINADSFVGRLQERAGLLLEPIAHWARPGVVRFIMAVGGLLVLLALLANNGALALMFGAAILPLVLISWCLNQDVFEQESPLIIAGFGLAGILLGAILGWAGSLIVESSWFKTGVLNYGAAGFGGEFASAAGNPSFLVWALVGIVFPLLALAAIVGGPLAMRQTASLRNEVMDGLTLGAVMGGGFSLGTAIIFAAPMLTHGGPVADASTWTLTTIGLTIIRPLVWTLSGGMLGAAAWRYLLTGRIGSALIPVTVGAASPLLFTLMSIELSPTGLWPEIIWGVIVVVIVSFFYKRTMAQAIEQDRQILGSDHSRVICPTCHQVTPAGQFCANCGSELAPSAGAATGK